MSRRSLAHRMSFSNLKVMLVTPISSLAAKLKAIYRCIQLPDTDPVTDFDERDLIIGAEKAGFSSINVELQIEVKPPETSD